MVRATLLIVDDDPVNLGLIQAQLHGDEYEILTATSGQGALDIARRIPSIDLILLDVRLPDIDGIEVCEALKADPKTQNIPVVLVSAFIRDEESIRRGLDAGADGYLAKPLEDTAIRAWVKATLRLHRLEAQLVRHTHQAAQTEESILQTFARLAHGVNNPLQALYAAADMLSLSIPEGTRQRQLVAEIFAQAERIAELVANASILAQERLKK